MLRARAIPGLLAAAAVLSLAACADDSHAGAAAAAGGDARRGAQAITRHGCGGCHTIPGIRNANGVVGPPLYFLGRRTFVAGHLANTPQNLAAWIRNPQAIEPRTPMPALGLTDQEIEDVVAYLYTLR
jgi:cytochrome c1